MTEQQLLGELNSLRARLAVMAASPAVAAARKLSAEIMPVLEPLWSIVVQPKQANGVGYLRQLDAAGPEVHALNTDVE